MKPTTTFTVATALLIGMSTVGAAQKGKEKAPPPQSHAAKPDAKEEKGESKEMKKDEKKETMEVKNAKEQPAHLLKGVKLTADQRKQVEAIEKKFETDLQALRKDEKTTDKNAKTPDAAAEAAYQAKVAALSAQERADIRAVVPAAEQAKFDANAAALDKKQAGEKKKP